MDIIDNGDGERDGLVQIAFADTREEAALVRGLLRDAGIRSLAKQASLNGPALGAGLLIRSPRRIYVRPEDADPARELIGETMVEEEPDEIPEPLNGGYLADATGNRPRNYSVLGAYARAWLLAAAVLGLALVIFLLLH